MVYFSIEYCLRVWSSGCRSKYRGPFGRLRFMRKPICLIGMSLFHCVFIRKKFCRSDSYNCNSGCVHNRVRWPGFCCICCTRGQVSTGLSLLQGFMCFKFVCQILRMLHVDRQGGTWRMLGSVVYLHRQVCL